MTLPAWRIVEARERAGGKIEPERPRAYPCPKCDYAARTEHGLAVHQGKYEHWDGDELAGLDECPACGRIISVGPPMVMHRRAHERFDNELIPSGQVEHVTADQLFAKDRLVAGELQPLQLQEVVRGTRAVRILSNARWWTVPAKTKFVRVLVSRRIDTRGNG